MSLVEDRLHRALSRQFDALGQMQERSGPIYEQARARSRIVSEAYKAAGSPRKVVRLLGGLCRPRIALGYHIHPHLWPQCGRRASLHVEPTAN